MTHATSTLVCLVQGGEEKIEGLCLTLIWVRILYTASFCGSAANDILNLMQNLYQHAALTISDLMAVLCTKKTSYFNCSQLRFFCDNI